MQKLIFLFLVPHSWYSENSTICKEECFYSIMNLPQKNNPFQGSNLSWRPMQASEALVMPSWLEITQTRLSNKSGKRTPLWRLVKNLPVCTTHNVNLLLEILGSHIAFLEFPQIFVRNNKTNNRPDSKQTNHAVPANETNSTWVVERI